MAGPRSTWKYLVFKNDENPEFGQSGFHYKEVLEGVHTQPFTWPIHRIFQRENFEDPELDYEILRPALQLASALLIAGLPFLQRILMCEPRVIPGTENYPHPLYSVPQPREVLLEAQEMMTRSRLSVMAERITFYFEGDDTTKGGACHPQPAVSFSSPLLQGMGSRIRIAAHIYQSIVEDGNDTDIVRREYLFFLLATTLVHELAHAAVFAGVDVDLKLDHRYIFVGTNANATTEHGFEMTAFLFGGVINRLTPSRGHLAHFYKEQNKPSKLERNITFIEWPCAAIVKHYDKHYNGRLQLLQPLGRQYRIEWSSSFLYIHKMFSDSFWEGDFAREGLKALAFEREEGYRFSAEPPILPLRPQGLENEVLEGFRLDMNGLLRPVLEIDEEFEKLMLNDEWTPFDIDGRQLEYGRDTP